MTGYAPLIKMQSRKQAEAQGRRRWEAHGEATILKGKQPSMAFSAEFAKTPLITVARLQSDFPACLAAPHPKWAGLATPIRDDDAFDVVDSLLRAGTKYVAHFRVASIVLAELFEITRYGNSVTVDSRDAGRPDAPLALRVTSTEGKPMPVRRLILGAGKNVAVTRADIESGNPHGSTTPLLYLEDYSYENLRGESAGKPDIEARERVAKWARERASKAARKYSLSGTDIEIYVANIRELFKKHDELYGPQS